MSAEPNPQYTNRLIHEKSPYLLQHAHNPVDWYPWGEEAFEKAKKEDKPIFLSIGYATCHWCHVMEHETFQNPEIAHLMNESFVNIKVDREERPEVDNLYMEFAQALMSSAGGWPLNVILTPELKPFFAATYLPPVTRKGLIGMDQFVQQIYSLWQSEERSILVDQAEKIVELFQKTTKNSGEDLPNEEDLQNAVQVLFDIVDPVFGGIKGEPKFPLGYQADFLLQYAKAHKDSRSLFYIDLTLQMMARGGIYDHLGGGFSRYTVDERWHIPHFEKMLYDNAILAKTYLEAYRFTKNPLFGDVCKRTLDYSLREMRGAQNGFYSAEDADSESQEGKFYVWSKEEIQKILGPKESEVFCRYYNVTEEGNFEGKNVLHISVPAAEFSQALGIKEEDLDELMSGLKIKLFEKRKERVKPFKDDKIITSWNGLMIDVLARAGLCFGEKTYLDAAVDAAKCMKTYLWVNGRLMRRFRDNEARFPGGLDDYAFMIRALLTLFETGLGLDHFQWALELVEILKQEYKSENGAFFQTKEDQFLLLRKCEFYDGAEPSGNAIHCENLLRLYQMTQNENYLSQAEDILKAAKPYIQTFPPGACYHLIALQRYLDQNAPCVVIALNAQRTFENDLKNSLGNHFFPHGVVLWKFSDDSKFTQLFPFTADQKCIDGKTTLYICKGSSCTPPITDKEEMLKLIETL